MIEPFEAHAHCPTCGCMRVAFKVKPFDRITREEYKANEARNRDKGTYFILCRNGGNPDYVKIGKVVGNIKAAQKRVVELQVGCPYELVLLKFTRNLNELETQEKFKEDLIRGEWFAYTEELRTFIDNL
jgi:hypothetical protein